MEGLEEKLAQYVSNSRFEDLSPAAIDSAKRSTLDTLGAMLAGSRAGGMETLIDLARGSGSAPEAHIIGRPLKLSALAAAWCNGAMARALEIDDCVDFLPVHPSASAVPALLALAEMKKGMSGRDFLTALAVGQDIIIRMGLAVRENAMESGRNNLFKIFGPAAAIARAMGLDSYQTHQAMGISFSFAVGDGQCALDGAAQTLSLQQGIVAQGALYSGLLAEQGFLGAREFLTGRFGYLVAFEPNPKLEHLTEGLGKEFHGERITIKPFSSCRATHPSIDLALRLIEAHELKPASITKITVRTTPEIHNLVAVPHQSKCRPESVSDAQFSIQFTLGAALIRGDMFLKELEPVCLGDPSILDVAKRVEVVPDESLRTDSVLGKTLMEIETLDLGIIECEVEAPLGSPKRAMTREACAEKLMKCAEYTHHSPPRELLEELIERSDRLEEMNDVSELFHYLTNGTE